MKTRQPSPVGDGTASNAANPPVNRIQKTPKSRHPHRPINPPLAGWPERMGAPENQVRHLRPVRTELRRFWNSHPVGITRDRSRNKRPLGRVLAEWPLG